MDTIYILGLGAIGFPLAAYLAQAGRRVVAVRTSRSDVPPSTITISVQNGENRISAPVETIALAQLTQLDGIIVITTKSHANAAIARALQDKVVHGPLVIMQNGVGVEQPFLDAQFAPIYRCVLYITSQASTEDSFTTRPIRPSPIGVVKGDITGLASCVAALSTEGFPFRVEASIEREIWRKATINAAFNSICPLLEVDNGIFIRDEAIANLAREIVQECVTLTDRLNLGLREDELMAQLLRISQGSDGQLISTFQDIRSGRETEIEFLNLAIARVAAAQKPPLLLPKVELLGRMIVAKALQRQGKELHNERISQS